MQKNMADSQAPSRWYQVCCSPFISSQYDLRKRVQATSPEGALRRVMYEAGVPFVRSASIWTLGRQGPPVTRENFSVRLPKVVR